MRQATIGRKNFKLTYFEEAYTSERWLVRIYKVLPMAEMAPALPKSQHPAATQSMPFVSKLEMPEF